MSLMLFAKSFIFVILLQNLIFVRTYDYCSEGKEEKLCRPGRRHIVCYKEQIEPAAEYQKHYPMTNRFREWLLYWHNSYRNELACGRVKGKEGKLPEASRLRELVWDYELEYIAAIHAGRCNMRHDQCRNTERIPVGGQNLAYHRTTGDPQHPFGRAERAITMWFEEAKDVPLSVIKAFQRMEGPPIGHFTVMSNDMVGRVGCAMVFCTGFPEAAKGYVYNYVSCNYDYNNMQTLPVYLDGPTASACSDFKVGRSSNFSCLCAPSVTTPLN